MKAAVEFTGTVKGKEKRFLPGDPITKAEAEALGLSEKPHLVQKETDDAAE